MRTRQIVRSSVVALAASGALTLVGAAPADAHGHDSAYQRHDLVSDVKGAATIQDPTLVNAWGMSQGPTSPVWVSDNGTDATTLYSGDGVVGPITKVPLTVSIPGHGPTGQVFNPTTEFVVSDWPGPLRRRPVHLRQRERLTSPAGARRSRRPPRPRRSSASTSTGPSTRAWRSACSTARPGCMPPTSTPARSTSSTGRSSRSRRRDPSGPQAPQALRALQRGRAERQALRRLRGPGRRCRG